MQPLAERLRPRTLDEYIGQQHLVGEGAVLRQMIESGNLSSFILWGPPGVGKTTLARIIAHQLERPIYTLSAVTSGVKDVRDVIDKAKQVRRTQQGLFAGQTDQRSPILFIDEIHRFSKSQQDSLLGAVEQGLVTLIGATTENPSFEVITPLLSRCQVYVLKPLGKDDLLTLMHRALEQDELIKQLHIEVLETESILRYAGGDARKMLNIIELVSNSGTTVIDNTTITQLLQQNPVAYDKDGELHYDIISAYIKSIRGSDPDAAVYYLARLSESGDLASICRRLVVIASEDIGLAYPQAAAIVKACVDSAFQVGFPEAGIPLANAVILLATVPKSNSAAMAYWSALGDVQNGYTGDVPEHLKDSHYGGAQKLDHGKGYKYPHSFEGNYVKQQYLPDAIKDKKYYNYGNNRLENASREYWKFKKK